MRALLRSAPQTPGGIPISARCGRRLDVSPSAIRAHLESLPPCIAGEGLWALDVLLRGDGHAPPFQTRNGPPPPLSDIRLRVTAGGQ